MQKQYSGLYYEIRVIRVHSLCTVCARYVYMQQYKKILEPLTCVGGAVLNRNGVEHKVSNTTAALEKVRAAGHFSPTAL